MVTKNKSLTSNINVIYICLHRGSFTLVIGTPRIYIGIFIMK